MPPISGPTVFVVDDDAAVRKAVSRLLRAAGIAVAAFASPTEFLAQYDPNTPGCLVVDLVMPGFGGLQLQRHLDKKGSILPIIFLTGHGDIPKSVQAMKLGAIDFLTKPVNDQCLLRAVCIAIEKDRLARLDQSIMSKMGTPGDLRRGAVSKKSARTTGENGRLNRHKLSAEESLKRMKEFDKRKERFIAAIRKSKNRSLPA